ncbi:MAG: flagellar hook-basal body complex protein FliE [Pseudomonadota bacterium]
MTISSLQSFDAMAAYGRSAGIGAGQGAATPAAPTKPAGGDFAQMVETAIGDAAGAVRTSEAVSAQAVQGKANMVDVVTAMNNAEMAMETVVAVRDKVIGAYQDIMRMPI